MVMTMMMMTDRSGWEDDEIDRLEKDVKESYGVMPDFASLAPEVVAEVMNFAHIGQVTILDNLDHTDLYRSYMSYRSYRFHKSYR